MFKVYQILLKVRGCSPAMGYSFAAGTTDGPGIDKEALANVDIRH